MTTNLDTQILIGADRLLDSPDQWLKGELYNGDYTAFCILGALNRAADQLGIPGGNSGRIFNRAWKRVVDNVPGGDFMTDYNNADTTSFADIKALLHKAIHAGA